MDLKRVKPAPGLNVLMPEREMKLLPAERRSRPSAEERFSIQNYTTELVIRAESTLVGKTVGDLEKAVDDVVVLAIIREEGHHYIPSANWPLYAGDIVTVQAEAAVVKQLVDEAKLNLEPAHKLERSESERDELITIEAVINAQSALLGKTPRTAELRRSYDVNVLAVSRAGQNRSSRLQTHIFEVGDVVVLQGWENELPATMQELGLLPLADRNLGLGRTTDGLIPLGILAAALVLAAMKVLTVAVGFFAAAVLVILLKQISLRQAYESIDGPVIVLLGSLIPIAHSLQTTGVTDILGHQLATVGAQVPGYMALGLMLLAAMLLTPFLNNAAAVLMLGPVAVVVAKSLGYNADPFLMAVALGCACDFLTPIGHQNNLLVMGPGGYRFTDYARLGLPISLLVLFFGTALIVTVWPL